MFGGKPPAWVQNVRYVATPQTETKYKNTTKALKMACEHLEVSDPFILMNDDFYITRRTQNIPALNRGYVIDVLEEYKERYPRGNSYIDGMERTLARLESMGYERPLSYELHTPLVVDKKTMLAALDAGSDLEVIHKRTMYGNMANLGGRKVDDVKVRRPSDPIPRGTFLSTVEGSFAEVRPVLRYLIGDDMCECESYVCNTQRVTPLTDPVVLSKNVVFGGKEYRNGTPVPLAVAKQMYQAGALRDDRLA